MPLPPMQYVKQYSEDCVKRGLQPPPPPPLQPNESYSMFGHQFTAEDSIIASLESQGIRRLYSAKDVDRKKELRKVYIIYGSNVNLVESFEEHIPISL